MAIIYRWGGGGGGGGGQCVHCREVVHSSECPLAEVPQYTATYTE